MRSVGPGTMAVVMQAWMTFTPAGAATTPGNPVRPGPLASIAPTTRFVPAPRATEVGGGFARAVGLYRSGKVREALAVLEGPDLGVAAGWVELYRGLCQEGLGSAAEAERRLVRAARLLPGDASVREALARVTAAAGRIGEALAWQRESVTLAPDDVHLWVGLGQLEAQAGHSTAALEAFRSASLLEPQQALALEEAALVHLWAGQGPDAEGELREAIRRDPTRATSHLLLGRALALQGQSTRAVEAFRVAFVLDRTLEPVGEREPPIGGGERALLARARSEAPTGREAEQIRRSREAQREIQLGHSAREQGEHEEAIRLFRRAIELDGGQARAHQGLGMALLDAGHVDAAIAAHEEALRRDPQMAQAHFGLGACQADRGRHDLAVTHYQRAVRLEAGFREALIGLGISLSEQGLHDEAVQAYREVLARDPRSAEAHYQLAVSLDARGDERGAVRGLEEAIRLDAGYADPHYTLGLIQLRRGDKGRALQEYQVLRSIDEDLAAELYRAMYP